MVNKWSTNSQRMVSKWSANGQQIVNKWSANGKKIVNEWSGFLNWHCELTLIIVCSVHGCLLWSLCWNMRTLFLQSELESPICFILRSTGLGQNEIFSPGKSSLPKAPRWRGGERYHDRVTNYIHLSSVCAFFPLSTFHVFVVLCSRNTLIAYENMLFRESKSLGETTI